MEVYDLIINIREKDDKYKQGKKIVERNVLVSV